MEWLQLMLSALAGAITGAFASIGTATRIARGNELGRVQEEARHRLLATVRLFRAHVAMERGDAGIRSAMDEDYLSARKRLRFAEEVEADLAHVDPELRDAVRRHIETLCGPVDARSAQLAAPLSIVERDTNWRTVYFLEQARGLTDAEVSDHGLLGRARDARLVGEGVPEVLAELQRLEETLNRHARLWNGWRLSRPRR
jgi:hypothetical protein